MGFFSLWLYLITASVHAAGPQPGDACTGANRIIMSGDVDSSVSRIMTCDGTLWNLAIEATSDGRSSVQVKEDTGACNSSKTGRLRFDGVSTWEYCNGSTWLPFERAAPGFLVQTSTRMAANFGGLAGADAACLTNLTANNWRNKSLAGTLTSSRVKAFLCDSTTCNSAQPNTTYLIAIAGNTGLGGTAFVTNSSGVGPDHEGYMDNDAFDSSFGFWSNRGSLSASQWSNSPATADHCTNWSSTAGNGRCGNMSNNNASRWNEFSYACSSTRFLLCFVHPN